jgi:thiol-disulfide isomerase/thioredoxin
LRRVVLGSLVGLVVLLSAFLESSAIGDSSEILPLRVAAFYSSTCENCQKAKAALRDTQRRWGDRVKVEHYDVGEMKNFRLMFLYEDYYHSTAQAPPKVFVGERYLEGYPAISKNLVKLVGEELEKGAKTFQPSAEQLVGNAQQPGEVPSEIVDRFKTYRAGAVAVAGLLDGVNPCAFTTIVFLLSMLAYLGKTRRQLAVVGAGFTTAVFTTYLLLGFGLLGAVKAFSISHGISACLAYIVAGLTFLLAGWSLLDYVRYRRSGDAGTATLGLPKSVKLSIHKVIRQGLATRWLLAGALAVGFLVAVLESLCTGQVYLPTMMFVWRDPSLRSRALGYLLLYNVMFILPLVGIFGIAYFGVSSERLGGFLRRRLGLLKLCMAGLFAALGVLVLTTV